MKGDSYLKNLQGPKSLGNLGCNACSTCNRATP